MVHCWFNETRNNWRTTVVTIAQSIAPKRLGYLPSIRDLFFIFALLILMSGFTLQLAGVDLSTPRQVGAGSLVSQTVIGAIYLVTIGILLRTPKALLAATRAWPIFLLPIFATISTIWAPDPELTTRRAIAFIGTTLFALCLASVYDFKGSIRVVIQTLVVAMAFSLFWAIVFPRTGIHQATDALEPIHAGKWRGILRTKTHWVLVPVSL